jgi:hypothetical protein
LLKPLWLSKLPLKAKVDISGHLLLPVLLLLVSLGVLASLVSILRNLITAPGPTLDLLMAGPLVPWWYLLGFIATPLIAGAYWRAEPNIGFFRGLVLAHAYNFYTWIWVPAGWKAVYRQLLGKGGWAKTDRVGLATAIPLQPLQLFAYDSVTSLDNGAVLEMLGLSPDITYEELVSELNNMLLAPLAAERYEQEIRRVFNQITARHRLGTFRDDLALSEARS